jgi:hypothetical protein
MYTVYKIKTSASYTHACTLSKLLHIRCHEDKKHFLSVTGYELAINEHQVHYACGTKSAFSKNKQALPEADQAHPHVRVSDVITHRARPR